jgi:hypothetical protein
VSIQTVSELWGTVPENVREDPSKEDAATKVFLRLHGGKLSFETTEGLKGFFLGVRRFFYRRFTDQYDLSKSLPVLQEFVLGPVKSKGQGVGQATEPGLSTKLAGLAELYNGMVQERNKHHSQSSDTHLPITHDRVFEHIRPEGGVDCFFKTHFPPEQNEGQPSLLRQSFTLMAPGTERAGLEQQYTTIMNRAQVLLLLPLTDEQRAFCVGVSNDLQGKGPRAFSGGKKMDQMLRQLGESLDPIQSKVFPREQQRLEALHTQAEELREAIRREKPPEGFSEFKADLLDEQDALAGYVLMDLKRSNCPQSLTVEKLKDFDKTIASQKDRFEQWKRQLSIFQGAKEIVSWADGVMEATKDSSLHDKIEELRRSANGLATGAQASLSPEDLGGISEQLAKCRDSFEQLKERYSMFVTANETANWARKVVTQRVFQEGSDLPAKIGRLGKVAEQMTQKVGSDDDIENLRDRIASMVKLKADYERELAQLPPANQ